MSNQEHLHQIAAHYDKAAKEYEEAYGTQLCQSEDEAVLRHLQQLLESMDLPAAAILRVIDVGCGEGIGNTFLEWVLERMTIGTTLQYVGVDISPRMLEKAWEELDQNPSYTQADMHHLPLPSNWAQLVMSLYGPFSYSTEPEALVEELKRVVDDTGTVVVMPYTQRLGTGWMTGFTTADPELATFYTAAEMKALFEEHFDEVTVLGISFFGNLIEELSKRAPSITADLATFDKVLELDDLVNDQGILPPEAARHMMVIAKGKKHAK